MPFKRFDSCPPPLIASQLPEKGARIPMLRWKHNERMG